MNELTEGKTMSNNDTIELFGHGSVIQHGKLNNRIYVMKLHENDADSIMEHISHLAEKHGYAKLFCKIPGYTAPIFIAKGFVTEAFVPKFYKGKETAFFMAKYIDKNRRILAEQDNMLELKHELKNASKQNEPQNNNTNAEQLTEDDAQEIASIYKQVFASYPFPIDDASYIKNTMNKDVQYFGIRENKKLIALSSAEIDRKEKNAEMTDFATLPQHRGKKTSTILLKQMEKAMKEQGIQTAYTIARLNSLPMNKTFLHLGYTYSGTLINNTNIAGAIESMNVLYKHL